MARTGGRCLLTEDDFVPTWYCRTTVFPSWSAVPIRSGMTGSRLFAGDGSMPFHGLSVCASVLSIGLSHRATRCFIEHVTAVTTFAITMNLPMLLGAVIVRQCDSVALRMPGAMLRRHNGCIC